MNNSTVLCSPKLNKKKLRAAQTFADKANKVHNNFYDYSKTIYIDSIVKITIICPIHGYFEQTPPNHLTGYGCRQCATERNTELKISKSRKGFVEKANIVHNNYYDYSKITYVSAITPIIIICQIHGEFSQTPHQHLSGGGCQKCGGSLPLTIDLFIEKSNKVHNFKYIYSKSIFVNTKTKLVITCKDHGDFKQSPEHHFEGKGCPACAKIISKPEIAWLNSFNIFLEKQKSIVIDNKLFKVDGLDPITNTVYEFYGDFWHGNPSKYSPQDINNANKKTFGELYQNTINKENILKLAGYEIISIWENDWNILNERKNRTNFS